MCVCVCVCACACVCACVTLFNISFKQGLVKGWLTNEINKRAIDDAEISDNRNGPQVGYDHVLYPRLHDIFDFLCFCIHKLKVQYR